MPTRDARPDPSVGIDRSRAGVARITMAKPAVFNAFDETMIAAIDAAFEQVDADPAVRVVVLAAEGRHFSAGADVQWMQRASIASFDDNVADARRFAAMLARISHCSKPTVARIQGAALGGGVGLACACDIAVADVRAVFSVSEARFGILPAVIGPHLLNAVGRRQAQRLALTAERIDATEALRIGLVQRVAASASVASSAADAADATEALDAAVDAVVTALLHGSPAAQREIKRYFAPMLAGDVGAELQERSAQAIARIRGTADAREGFAAFLAKRPPEWSA